MASIRHLVGLGINVRDAIEAGLSSKGQYCMSRARMLPRANAPELSVQTD